MAHRSKTDTRRLKHHLTGYSFLGYDSDDGVSATGFDSGQGAPLPEWFTGVRRVSIPMVDIYLAPRLTPRLSPDPKRIDRLEGKYQGVVVF